MSTIGGLLLPQFQPYDLGRTMQQATNIAGGMANTQTALLQLADLKRSQASVAEVRAFLQQHPELIVGGGGQGQPMPTLSTLQTAPGGPLTQQAFGPGGVGATQTIPPGQDLSRFAAAAPGGGPPGTVPPPTLATLGQPQPQANPLMDLMRRNPDAAMAVMQRQQQWREQQLTMGTKVAEYVGRVAQGVTDQPSLDQARQELARIHPQAAAQLPQVYSKEAMVPFIKKAVGVADNAKLQLETWQRQIEEQKLGVQLAQAGYQGLGTGVTDILRGLTPEQVEQFGGRTSPAAVAYATEEEKQRKLAQVRETEIQRGKTERELRSDKTVSEAMAGKATNLYNTQTGTQLDTRMTMKEYDAMPPGTVRELSEDNRKQMETIQSVMPVITQLQKHIDALYGPGGVLARMTSDERADLAAAPERWAKQYAQKYPELAQAQKFIDANAGSLARALAGERGAMAEGDVERAKALLPNVTTSLNVWPPNKLAIQAPDTRGVALRTMNDMVDMINARTSRLLGNPQFQHPELHRYQTAEDAQREAGSPVAPRTRVPPVALPPPAQGPAPGPTIFPRPQIAIPGEASPPPLPSAPSTRPTPPTATSTPTQDEASRQPEGQGTPTPPSQAAAPPAGQTPADAALARYRRQFQGKSRAEVRALATQLGKGALSQGDRAAMEIAASEAMTVPAPAPAQAPPTPGRQSQATGGVAQRRGARAGAPKTMELRDVVEAMRQTGKSRREVEAAARARGYTVFGSALTLPGESRMA